MKNIQSKIKKSEIIPHFGLRKLSVGLASMLLSTTLFLGNNANTTHAATNNDGDNNENDESVENSQDADDFARPTTENESNENDEENLNSAEIERFNEQFEEYAGDSQRGSSVTRLVSMLVSNATTNEGNSEFLLTVEFGDTTISGGENAVDDSEQYVADLTSLRTEVMSTRTYLVTVEYSEDDIINKIVIEEN